MLKWPWLVNYHGEAGDGTSISNLGIRYLWIDQDLKKTMGK